MSGYNPQRTIRYSTYIKRALVEAVRDVFKNHEDEDLQRTKVTIESPKTKADYPSTIIKFYERKISPIGVGGGEEWIDLEHLGFPGSYRFKRSLYWADIELEAQALSSLDRDLVGDSVVQTLQMGNLEAYTNRFFERIYPSNYDMEHSWPDSVWHHVSINTDDVSGFGENQSQTQWGSEDGLVYRKSYRVPVLGEFYSLPPDVPAGFVEAVYSYPYIGGVEEVPQGLPGEHGEWEPLIGL